MSPYILLLLSLLSSLHATPIRGGDLHGDDRPLNLGHPDYQHEWVVYEQQQIIKHEQIQNQIEDGEVIHSIETIQSVEEQQIDMTIHEQDVQLVSDEQPMDVVDIQEKRIHTPIDRIQPVLASDDDRIDHDIHQPLYAGVAIPQPIAMLSATNAIIPVGINNIRTIRDATHGYVLERVFEITQKRSALTLTTQSLSTSYTKSIWMYAYDTIGYPHLMGSPMGNAMTPIAAHYLYLWGGRLIGGHAVKGKRYQILDTTAIDVNTWIHVIFTYDNDNKEFRLYRDGNLVSRGIGPIGWIQGQHTIVANQDGFYGFNGRMDRIQIWNQALSATQVTQLYNNEKVMSIDDGIVSTATVPTMRPTTMAPTTTAATVAPTTSMTQKPTITVSTAGPTKAPTQAPTQAATQVPTPAPTVAPTQAPTTRAPTAAPTTKAPTQAPTQAQTQAPTTKAPTAAPTAAPTTKAPTAAPTTQAPTAAPTTKAPTAAPTTKAPTQPPTTKAPTQPPTTQAPTAASTAAPTPAPTPAIVNAGFRDPQIPSGAVMGTSTQKISYRGGQVMLGALKVYIIYYGGWSQTDPIFTLVPQFVNGLSGSGWWNIQSTYYQQIAGVISRPSNELSFGAYSTEQGTEAGSYSKIISDSSVYSLIHKHISTGKLPYDPQGMYMVLSAPDVAIQSGFCTAYCGWHTSATASRTYARTGRVRYGFIGSGIRCPSQCLPSINPAVSPNGDRNADGMLSILAHELAETVSDPDLNAWLDSSSYENADKCAWNFGKSMNQIYTTSNGAKANLRLNGKDYLIQSNWVNHQSGYCAMST